jgi:hypothetical protein
MLIHFSILKDLILFFLPLLCKLKPKIEDCDGSNSSNDNATISVTNIDNIDNR